jgi:uncharacterized membrane protein YqjE
MENLKDKIFKLLRLDNLMDNLSGYVETRLELYKLEIGEDIAKVLSKVLIYAFIAVLGMLFLVFFSVGLAHFLNVFFAGAFVGYWIVAGIYGLALLIFMIFRKSIDRNFENHFMDIIKRKHK